MKRKIIRITTVPGSFYGLLKGQLDFMSDHYDVIGISSSTNKNNILEKIGENEGIDVIPVEMTRKITPLKDLIATWKLINIFRKEKPFIVHTHTPKAGTLGMIAAYIAGVPNRLHTIAGLPLLEITGTKRWVLDQVEKMTYYCATRIYPNSHGLKDIIIKNRYTRDAKLKVIGNGSSNGINLGHFDPKKYTRKNKEELRKSLNIKGDDFVFIFVGRLVKDKGINELVEAFDQIQKSNDKVKLLLVGPYEKELDPLDKKIEEKIVSCENIIEVGWKDDVRPFFAIADILTFPSYREGFPNVVMQAGAMGIKSIVTNINGCNEIIIDGKNGWLINTKDVHDLVNKMLIALKGSHNKDDYKLCRSLIKDRFDQNFVWSLILEEYKSLE